MRCAVTQLSKHKYADNHLALPNRMSFKHSFQDSMPTAAQKAQCCVTCTKMIISSHTDSMIDSVTDSVTDSD